MSANTGTIIAAAVRPADSSDSYASAIANEIQGGLHSVANETARDAITTARRVEGMLCYVVADDKTYQLKGGIDNTDWVEYSVDVSGLVPYTGADDDVDLGTNSLTAGYDSIIGNLGTDSSYLKIEERSIYEGAIKLPYLVPYTYIDEAEATTPFAFVTDGIILKEQYLGIADPKLYFADKTDVVFGTISIDVADTGDMNFVLDLEVGSGIFTFNNNLSVLGNVVSTGWDSQFGSTTQYFLIEQLDLGAFGSLPMMSAHTEFGVDTYEIGIFADAFAIYDKAQTGGPTVMFVADDFTTTNNLAVIAFDTANEKMIMGLAESDSITVEIAGTLVVDGASGVDASITLGSTMLDEPTLETLLASIDLVNYALYLGASDTNGSWRIFRNGANLEFQRRESDAWVKKGEFTAS